MTFWACKNSVNETQNNLDSSVSIKRDSSYSKNSTDSLKKDSEIKDMEIVIKNKEDYSENFISGLKNLGYKNFRLIDSLLIIDKKDSFVFSKSPKIGEQRTYIGSQDNITIKITVNRINYTTIDYRINMIESGKVAYNQSGKADIISTFFLGTETDEIERTGETYSVEEFIDQKTNNCYTKIRIGDDNKCAKLVKNCNENIKDITLDNFTTLYKK